MKQYLFILFLFLITLSLSLTPLPCPKKEKKCFENNTVLSSPACYLSGKDGFGSDSQDTYYYRSCNTGEKCHIDPLSGVGQCVKIIEKKKEGEECISMSECESVTCIEGKCSHVLDGSVCNENENCGLGSFCMNQREGNYSICAPLRQKGEECGNDDYCAFNMACGTLDKDSPTKHCEIMFSLDAGAMNDNNLLCKSGLASMIPDGKTYYCADYKMDKPTCTLQQNCTMTITASPTLSKEYKDTCKCKWDGTSLCRLDSSSTQWTNFVETYNKEVQVLKEEDIKKIHVVLQRGNWWG